MTDPLTPADLDLRDFGYMPLDVVRLRDSESAVLCSGEEFRAAVLLWCAAWHQVPAASLPNDDRLLANLAGFGRDMKRWAAAREGALRGFILCSDGRLYHPVIVEKAIEAASKKREQRERTAAATEAARLAREARNAERAAQRDADRNGDGNGFQGKGREGKAEDAASPPSDEVEFFRRGKQVLGNDAGGLLAKLLKAKNGSVPLARAVVEQASTKENAREYVGRVLSPARSGPALTPSGAPYPEGII